MNLVGASIYADVEMLCEQIGPRPSFSPANRAAADYLAGRMQALGLDVEWQPFDCPAWACDKAELTVGGAAYEVLPNPFSPSCDVQAGLARVGTLEELEKVQARGKILVLYGDLTRQPIACKGWFLKEPRDERIVALLEQIQPAAVLAVQAQPGSVNRIIEDFDVHIPSATVPAETALRLFGEMGEPGHLRIEAQAGVSQTANVIGRWAGTIGEWVVLCAHYDTKIDTPGALDNATGAACMLAAAEMLLDQRPSFGVECVAFTNEEYLPIGDDLYLAMGGEGFLERVRLAINFDGVGNRIGVNTLAIFTDSEELQARVEEEKVGYPGVQWVEPWPESNHSTFAWRGVPSLALSSSGFAGIAHQMEDRLEFVSVGRVAEAARLAADIVLATQNLITRKSQT